MTGEGAGDGGADDAGDEVGGGAFVHELAFVRGPRGEDPGEHPPGRGGAVDALPPRPPPHRPGGQPLDGADRCRQRPAQPVEGSDDHGVPVADVGEEGDQAWEVVAGPGQGVGEDPLTPTAVNPSYRTSRFWWSVLTQA